MRDGRIIGAATAKDLEELGILALVTTGKIHGWHNGDVTRKVANIIGVDLSPANSSENG
jgi:hypothetical protein